MNIEESAGCVLFAGVGVPGPGATAHTMTGSRRCVMDNDGMEDDGGSFGVPGTRSRVRVGANRRARLRDTLGGQWGRWIRMKQGHRKAGGVEHRMTGDGEDVSTRDDPEHHRVTF